jgi:tRNA threonylcarbamoyl adenosine modification protein YjeE
MAAATLARLLPGEDDTLLLGQDLALALRAGDLLALSGDIGAGKTTLARAIIRADAGDPELDVPSPTYTLVQSYGGRVAIGHFDLYRIADPAEIEELGLGEVLEGGAALVEWPQRAGGRLPASTVWVEIEEEGEGRSATIRGEGAAFERIARSLAIRDFLVASGFGEAERTRFSDDASARAYELVRSPGIDDLVLMNSPRLVLGPPVKDGRPYAEIAHTAQTVTPFVVIDHALRRRGLAAPRIVAADVEAGFLLLEHLGTGAFLDPEGRPIADRYAAAAALLAVLHAEPWPLRMEAPGGLAHTLPPFDRDALMIEVELLPAWYVPWKTGQQADAAFLSAFAEAWNAVFDRLDRAEKSILLRDYHSPNIVWRSDRTGLDRLGILDFQDALFGPAAYDVASLAMDARVTVPEEIEAASVDAYIAARRDAGSFAEAGFREAYAICAAQRNTKILGIFVRLKQRDGKPGYIRHLPRIRAYLRRALAHPALAPVARLYERHGLLAEDE